MNVPTRKLHLTAISPAQASPGEPLTLQLASVPKATRISVWFGSTRAIATPQTETTLTVEVPQLSSGKYDVWVSYIHVEGIESTGLEVSSNRLPLSVPLRILGSPLYYRLTHPLNPTTRLNLVAVPLSPTPNINQTLALHLHNATHDYHTDRVMRTTLNLDVEDTLTINRRLTQALGQRGIALSIHAVLKPVSVREWLLIDPSAGIFRIVLIEHRYVVYYALNTASVRGLVAFSVGALEAGVYHLWVSANGTDAHPPSDAPYQLLIPR